MKDINWCHYTEFPKSLTWDELSALVPCTLQDGFRIHVTDRNQTYIVKDGKYVPEITWTNCAEQMPPNGLRVIIHAYGEYMKFVWDTDTLNHIASSKINWTPYTKEKWEYLNK